jgi:hypothetical protein
MAGQGHKLGVTRESASDQEMRDQEVLRANKELAAYFKGRRTEREARAALKIIKAFVRDRERQGVKNRPPLPGADPVKTPKKITNRKAATGERHRRKPRRQPQRQFLDSETSSIKPQLNPPPPQSSESDERTPE